MGWLDRKQAGLSANRGAEAAARAENQGSWVKITLKKLVARFKGKSAKVVPDHKIEPQIKSEQYRNELRSDESVSLQSRQMSGSHRMGKRGLFSSRNKLEKLASKKKLNQDQVSQALLIDARRGGPDMLKMLHADVDGLARLLKILPLEQQLNWMTVFSNNGEGARAPDEARLIADLVFKVQSGWSDKEKSKHLNEMLLGITGNRYRPYILTAVMAQANKHGMLSYGTLQHFTQHYYHSESLHFQNDMAMGKSIDLGISAATAEHFSGGRELLTILNSGMPPSNDSTLSHSQELMQLSVKGRLLAAAQAPNGSPPLEKMILTFDHMSREGIPRYNEQYGKGRQLIGVDDKSMIAVMDKLTPNCLVEVRKAKPGKVSEVISRYGWRELLPTEQRTPENTAADFMARYLKQYVGPPPPKPPRAES